MATGDREQILNVPNESINRKDINPATLLRKVVAGAGISVSDSGLGDSTIAAARTITRIVAASNSDAKSKAAADYICDGTADNVEIQAAIDATELVGGCVLLLEGTYNTTSQLVIDANITFAGIGIGQTTIVASNCNGILVQVSTSYLGRTALRDFTLNTDVTNKYGISLETGLGHTVYNVVLGGHVTANDYWARGIYLKGTDQSWLENIHVVGGVWTDERGAGIYLDYSVNINITNCQLWALNKCIELSITTDPSGGNYCEGIFITNNTMLHSNYGVYANAGIYINIASSMIDLCETIGIYFATNVTKGSVQNCYIGPHNGGPGVNWVGIELVGCDRTHVVGNQFFGDTGAGYGVKLDATAHYCTITANEFYYLDYGIHSGADGVAISANVFTQIDVDAIELNGDSNVVVGNQCSGENIDNNGANNEIAHNNANVI